MPSKASNEFTKNMTDVARLISDHKNANMSRKPGRRALGHLTKGGILLLCAAWERYVETVLEEGATFLTTRLSGFVELPANAQRKTRDNANSNKTPWKAADLQGPVWTSVYLDALTRRTSTLHAPTYRKLKPLFADFLDVPDIAAAWLKGDKAIDSFVSRRGGVAHRGGQAAYVRIGYLIETKCVVESYVEETDNFLSDHIRRLVTPSRRPWNRVL